MYLCQKKLQAEACIGASTVSENDTFESVIIESVKIESVRVDRHPLYVYLKKKIYTDQKVLKPMYGDPVFGSMYLNGSSAGRATHLAAYFNAALIEVSQDFWVAPPTC